jgi:hypothetical protein
MSIYRLLRNTPVGEAGHLIAAYELTLRALDVVDRNDPLTTMIAKKVLYQIPEAVTPVRGYPNQHPFDSTWRTMEVRHAYPASC